jgi:DNA repair photolyase
MQHLKVKHDGTTVFDLLKELVSKVQINGSIGIMPSYLRNILEPNVAGIKERLEVLQECRNAGIWAESVLCQPLLIPYLKEDVIRDYMKQLSDAGVKNIKPEFFTAKIRNLVLVAQYIHYYDPGMTGEFFHSYLSESNQKHIKQRSRLAPEKKICVEKLSLIRDIADEYDISISLCNWVKKELNDEAPFIREIDKKSLAQGYRCLGYQTRLFNTSNEQ